MIAYRKSQQGELISGHIVPKIYIRTGFIKKENSIKPLLQWSFIAEKVFFENKWYKLSYFNIGTKFFPGSIAPVNGIMTCKISLIKEVIA